MRLSDNYTRRISLIVPLMVVVSLLLVANGFSAAQDIATQDQATFLPGPTILTRLDPQSRQRYVPPPAGYYQNLVTPNATDSADIVVKFVGGDWTDDSKAAFEFAAGIWETLITSTVPIVINAQFGPLPVDVLGKAGSTTLTRDFPNAEKTKTWYPIATANKLAGFDLAENVDDIDAIFSSSFSDWYFGTEDTPIGKVNFASVVLHEIGHGLGFAGSMKMDDGAGMVECAGVAGEACYGVDDEFKYPMVFDRYTEDSDGTALLTYSNNSTDLASQLTSDNIYFDSPGAKYANGGDRVQLYAPSTWLPGSSYGHLAESFNSTSHALMTFMIASGETIYNPGAVTLCMFDNMGWTVSETCPVHGLAAENDSPTILGSTTYFSATITAGSNVSYTWAFGDGQFGSGWQVDHLYDSVGPFTAIVTATNSISQEAITTQVQITPARTYLPVAVNENP